MQSPRELRRPDNGAVGVCRLASMKCSLRGNCNCPDSRQSGPHSPRLNEVQFQKELRLVVTPDMGRQGLPQ